MTIRNMMQSKCDFTAAVYLMCIAAVAGVITTSNRVTADEERIILTPKPGPEPRINGPRLFGCGPAVPFCTAFRARVSGRLSSRSTAFRKACSSTPPAESSRGTLREERRVCRHSEREERSRQYCH